MKPTHPRGLALFISAIALCLSGLGWLFWKAMQATETLPPLPIAAKGAMVAACAGALLLLCLFMALRRR
jgi:hypothetical protein